MDDPRPPNRTDLAQFIRDQRTLRAFEQLFKLVPSEFNSIASLLQEVSISAGSAEAQGAQNAKSLQVIADSLAAIAQAPAMAWPHSFPVDYIDFNGTPPHSEVPRRVVWNADDDTLNIHHLDNVVQQVGLETYIRVINNTGSTIQNGTVVGFGGVSGGFIQGVPYLADGSVPIGYVGGVATQDIPNGAIGRVTDFGYVRTLDTSAFSVGAILYASPTVAGALTATKPTAPAFAIPIGFVEESDAVTGQIFVRPLLEQTKRYGTFIKTTDQTPAAINTAYAITLDSAVSANGFALGTPASRVVASFSGLYTFGASFQLVSGSASVKNVWLWFRKNGTDIANSALKCSLESGTAINTQHRSITISMAAGDYVELMWAADSTNVTLDNIASTAFAPAAPAVTLTVDQIQQ